MNRIFNLLVILILITFTARAQPEWNRIYPQPIIGLLDYVQFTDQLHGHIMAHGINRSYLYKTNDGAVTWTIDSSFFKIKGAGLLLNDAKFGWMSDISGYIYHTNDSGNNYLLCDSSTSSYYAANGCVTDSLHAWFYYADTAFFTHDMGQSWQKVVVDSAINIKDIFFLSNQKGWICSDSGTYYSNDNGFTWSKQIFVPGYTLNSINFIDSLNGIAAGADSWPSLHGIIMRTTDGGINWQITDTSHTGLYSIRMVDNAHVIAFGYQYSVPDSSSVIYSSDSGNTWAWAPMPMNEIYAKNPRGISVLNNGVCYIVTDNVSILKSVDYGVNWNTLSKTIIGGYNSFTSMSFSDSLNGWLTDNPFGVYKTINGGTDWVKQNTVLPNFQYDNVIFPSRDTGWFSGRIGFYDYYIIRTTDGGNSFITQFNTSTVLPQLSFNNTHHGIASGNNLIKCTFNSGDTWLTGSLPGGLGSISIRNIFILNDNFAWALAQMQQSPWTYYVLKSTNGGLSWNNLYTSSLGGDLTKLFFINNQLGYLIKQNSGYPQLYRTINGGISWSGVSIFNIPFQPNTIFSNLYFSDSLNGIFTGGCSGQYQSGFILTTNDGCNTFEMSYLDSTCSALSNISFIDTSRIYVSGGSGSFISKVVYPSIPTESMTNYSENYLDIAFSPNPATSSCTITAPNFLNSTLTLYDITGRSLLQQSFNTQTTIDISTLTSGVYIVEVKDKEGRNVKGKVVKE